MEQVQIKNKNIRKRRSRGRLLDWSLANLAQSPDRALVTRPDRGRPTVLWLVGPRRAAHIKAGGGPHRSSTKVRRRSPPPTDLTLTRSRERSGDGKLRWRHFPDASLRPRRRPVLLAARGPPTPTPTFATAGRALLRPGVRRRHHRYDYSELQRLRPAT